MVGIKTAATVAAIAVLGVALAIAPFRKAKAQSAPDTLFAKPKTKLVKPYPVLSGFSLLPNPAARFRLGTYFYPFADFAPKTEPVWGLQANMVFKSTGVTATRTSNGITAALFQKIGPLVIAAEMSSGTGKPAFGIAYEIRHDERMLATAGLMYSSADGAWTAAGEWRLAPSKEWDITPSFTLTVPDKGRMTGGLGLQAAHKGIRVAAGSNGQSFNLDLQGVVAIPIGKGTLLLLPEGFVSVGLDGLKMTEIGLTIIY